jgi:sugar/nucleoside kinase (ribokinase family)
MTEPGRTPALPHSRTRKLGVLGTFVWDTIWTLADVQAGRAFETWGGLAYSLAAAAAARPPGWEIVPLARVGADLSDEAHAFMTALPGVSAGPGILTVPEPNNRVELRYTDAARRGERLTGGVEPWTWDELEPRVAGLDALYVNFLSGFEMRLETAERLRNRFGGPTYCDLHSLFLGCPGKGERQPRKLPEWERWVACFDAIQLNADELGEIGDPGEPVDARIGRLLGAGPGLVLVTLGNQGAAAASQSHLPADPLSWPAHRGSASPTGPASVETHPVTPAEGDPTGCGDVWGTTCFASLLAGCGVSQAVSRSHAAALRKLSHRGATGLYEHLAASR